MSETKKGFVKKIFKKDGKNSRGPWYAISFKLEDPEGNEDPMYYQLGFNKPCGFKENDYIQFEAEPKDARAMTVVEGSGKILKNPPARSAPKSSGGGQGRSRGGFSGPKEKQSDLFGSIGGYNTEDDIRRMSYTAARGAAIQAVDVLMKHDALPTSTANSKAGQAKRYEDMMNAIDKLTVEYFFDAAKGRKLDTVADAGVVDTSPDAQLPDVDEQPEPEFDDELPPVDDGDIDGAF